MDKIFEANVKFNTESSSIIVKNKEENELLNNNNKNGVCCKDIINGCHSNNSPIENNVAENIQRNENDNSVTSKPSPLKVDFLDENALNRRSESDNSNAASSNNSTDNLSYLSDNCIVEEIILSDEELSKNSDDCIYAYRGGADYGLSEENRYGGGIAGGSGGVGGNGSNQLDDETDFLEMDFEPDPASELEHSIEIDDKCSNNDTNHFQCKFSATTEFNSIESIRSDAKIKYSTDKNAIEVNEQTLNEPHVRGNDTTTNDLKIDHNLFPSSNKNDSKYVDSKTKTTGAKRKKFLDKNSKPLPSTSTSKLNTNDTDVKIKSRTYRKLECNTESLIENDDICLDCLEKEFLSKTIGKNVDVTMQCSKCKSMSRIPNKFNNGFHKNNQHLNFDINDYEYQSYQKKNMTMLAVEQSSYHQKLDEPLRDCISESLCYGNSSKIRAKFSSLNVDEKTIVQALDKLDITYNKDIIIEYFNSSREMNVSDVPEFIVYMSKKNCDYKRIIRLIKMACKEKLHIEFIPNLNATSPEIVEINIYDIMQRWNRKNDLGKLKKLDKRFSEMNVLGKIINLLRQAQQRNTKPLGEFIEIPQYYKTGYICITKI